MDIGKVLVINDGLSKPRDEKEDGIKFYHRGLQDITAGEYAIIVLQWVNGIVIGKSLSHSSDQIISTDIHRVLEKIREKMAGFNTPSGIPIIIESKNGEVTGLETLAPLETNFLIRRILSGNTSDNTRNIALINPPNKHFSWWAQGDAETISRQYPHIKFHFGSPFDCLFDIAEGKHFDSISLCHHVGKYYPKPLEKEPIIGEDTKAYLRRVTPYTLRKTPEFVSVMESCQTGCPTALINEFSDGCSRHHIECLKVYISPELNIPSFLDKCPKV